MEERDATVDEDTSNVHAMSDEEDEETKNAVRVNRGLGAILASIGGGTHGNRFGGNKKPPPLKVNMPKQRSQENLGFDLNLMEEFSGWGDIRSREGANAEPLNISLRTEQKANTFNREVNAHQQQPQGNLGFDLNLIEGFSGWGALTSGTGAFTEPLNTQKMNDFDRGEGNRRKSTNAGFKRDTPQDQDEDNKRFRHADDSNQYEQADDSIGSQDFDQYNYGLKEVTSWADMCQYNDDHDSEWFAVENKRLAEEYGGTFISVKYIEGQQGKVGYYCELCQAEMNAKKSLELHCGGMKHLKKKNVWEKTKGNPDAIEQPKEPRPIHPVHDEPKTRGGGKPGRNPGPPPRGQLLPPSAFVRSKERDNRLDRDRPGRPDRDRPGRPDRDRPGRPDRNRPGRPDRDRPGRPDRDRPGRPDRDRPSRPDRDRPSRPDRDRPSRPDRDRLGRADHDRPGSRRVDSFGRNHSRFEPRSEELRNQDDQGGFGRRENHRGDRQPYDNPHNDRRDDRNRTPTSRFDHHSPPPFASRAPASAAPAPQENFSGGTTGALVKRLSDCSVKSADDARLATEVISLLLKSLKDFQLKKGDDNSVLLLQESEDKFNIMKALQNTTQTRRFNSSPGHVQNPGHLQNEPRPAFNQVERFPEQNYYPPPGAPDYQMGNGQVHYSAPPLRYNK